ncbi:hypothetical protein ACRALDRAFT_2024401 [Sodiomyces alcalophilus JCM 7366]|uniref:uncharacterized protein n=1 Tax=Sodiomyces alcalophilus JCM 7366 TaxID=591952 RepID=UPI0039B5EA5C
MSTPSALHNPQSDGPEGPKVHRNTTLTFHGFPKLPPELRLRIWELSIRPRGPGVHYFSFSKTSNKDDEKKQVNRPDSLALVNPRFFEDGKPRYLTRYAAANPIIPIYGTAEHSWFNGSRSFSRWDAGLWTACKESRYVIRRYLAKNKDIYKRSFLARAQHNGEDMYLRVQPGDDLFCLEVSDLSEVPSIQWRHLISHFPLCHLHPVNNPGGQKARHARRPKHIAFEFHPDWLESLPETLEELEDEPSPRGLVARAVLASARREIDCAIWLIDHNLHRACPPLEPAPRTVFTNGEHTYYEATYTQFRVHNDVEAFRRSAFYFSLKMTVWNHMYCFRRRHEQVQGQRLPANSLPVDLYCY